MTTTIDSLYVERLAVSKREAATLLGISLRTINEMIARGEIASVKIRRRRVIPLACLTAIIGTATVQTAAKG
jgi:excisionase family DNA binding protein